MTQGTWRGIALLVTLGELGGCEAEGDAPLPVELFPEMVLSSTVTPWHSTPSMPPPLGAVLPVISLLSLTLSCPNKL